MNWKEYDWDSPTTWKMVRKETLEVMVLALRWYKRTGDPFYMEQAKQLGITSRQLKERC